MKQQIWIYASWSKYSKQFNYTVKDYEIEGNGYVLLSTQEIEFESPEERELRIKAAEVLRADLQKLRGEHYVAEKEKEEEIQELLALEDKSQEQPVEAPTESENDLPF